MIPTKPADVTWTDEQWEAIYLTGKNIIVSAGAGSGKTAVLTERIIEKIKSGVSINDMIILTFTNAAAAEMRERVRDKIVNAAKENPNLKEQVYLIDQAPITTFDAYSLSLLKKYHYLLGISNNINVIDNVLLVSKKEEILDSILEEEYENEDFLKLLDIYTNKDDVLIRNSILSIYSKIDSICKKTEYLDTYIEKYYDDNFINEKLEEYLKLIRDTSDVILMLIECIKNIVSNEVLVEFISKIEESLDELNYCKKYEDYKRVIELYSLPAMTRSKKVDEEEKEEIKGYYEKLKKYFEDLKSLLVYDSLEEIKNEIVSTKEYAKVIIRILKKLDEKVLEFKKENNSYEFSDITRLSIKLLEEYDEIREGIKDKTNEIMIDEYQDTNDIGDYFISLISNNNVYMVGDVKQSIYRFRNANPRIFMEKYHNYKQGNGGYALDLTKNFRSRCEVLDNINEMFNYIMDEEIGGANYQNGHNMIYGNKTYINEGKTDQNYNLEIYNYDYKTTDNKKYYSKDEVEAFIIADDIINRIKAKEQTFNMKKKELRDIKYSDFVILIDRKSNFELYKKVFDYKGIPLIMHKDEEFVYSNEIYVLKNILKLIDIFNKKEYSNLEYPFISVARSYLYKFDDNDIFTSVTNKDMLTNSTFKEFFESINRLSKISNEKSLSNLIIEIYKEYDFYLKSIRIGNVSNVNKKLDYIVDVASNLENIGYTLEDFITYFDNVFDKKLDIQFSNKKDTSSNSVNIMSIHNSKGLEYPVCYFPSLYKKFNKADLKDKFLFSYEYGIVMPVFKEGLTDTIYKRLLSDNYLKEDIAERLRVLYVAVTRAKEKMIMVNPIMESEDSILPFENGLVNNLERLKYSSFEDVIVSLKNELKKYIKTLSYTVNKNYEKELKVDYKEKIVASSFKYDTETINIKNELIEETSYSHKRDTIEKIDNEAGLNIHEVLEYLDFKNYKEDIQKYEVSNFFKEKIEKMFEMPFMEDISNSKVYKEFEFYDNESHGIMDLLIEKEDKFIIVDYKLKNIDEEYYIEQINGYIDYLKKITSKDIEGYLYSIIESRYKKIK
ncbi:MAG: UvrD-helicase domain-containing protein [Bacilli bacterium]|nr:UvrD-helicase domain-containing protein [Bacilli bacterium]